MFFALLPSILMSLSLGSLYPSAITLLSLMSHLFFHLTLTSLHLFSLLHHSLLPYLHFFVSSFLDCEVLPCVLIPPSVPSDFHAKYLLDTHDRLFHFTFQFVLHIFHVFIDLFPLMFFHFIQGLPLLKIFILKCAILGKMSRGFFLILIH